MKTAIDMRDDRVLKTDRLKKTGEEYCLMLLSLENIDQILTLQDIALAHLTANEKIFLAKKSRNFFEKHFAAGNEMLGIVHGGRLAAQAIIVNPTPERPETGIDMQINLPVERIAVLQGAIVDPAYRGNNLQGLLIDERLALSERNGRTQIFSEVATANSFSWSVLLQKGLHMEGTGISPFTGAEVYVFHGHIPLSESIFDGSAVSCPLMDIARQKKLMAEGYKGTKFDSVNALITFQHLLGNRPCP